MIKCPLCKKTIPENQKIPLPDIDHNVPNPVDDLMRRGMAFTKAWQCNSCGEWICNDCITKTVVQNLTSKINHSNCRKGSGTIQAPTESTILDVQFKYPRWAFWRWEIF